VTRLVECVPNFSEGRRPDVVDELAATVAATPDVYLLDRTSDTDHNRSVLTFAGPPEPVAAAITRRLTIPTIGIGSGAACDGQVLVLHDLLDIRPDSDFAPRFVKQFAHIGAAMRAGVEAYATEVRSRAYPASEHTYPIDADQLAAFEIAVEAGASGADNVLADW